MKKNLSLLLFFLLLILPAVLHWSGVFAQCSMCRAVAESAQDENNISAGLNLGILYLLAIPYVLITGLIVFFFRKPISEKLRSLKK